MGWLINLSVQTFQRWLILFVTNWNEHQFMGYCLIPLHHTLVIERLGYELFNITILYMY